VVKHQTVEAFGDPVQRLGVGHIDRREARAEHLATAGMRTERRPRISSSAGRSSSSQSLLSPW
jgi:hypothetical protein